MEKRCPYSSRKTVKKLKIDASWNQARKIGSWYRKIKILNSISSKREVIREGGYECWVLKLSEGSQWN